MRARVNRNSSNSVSFSLLRADFATTVNKNETHCPTRTRIQLLIEPRFSSISHAHTHPRCLFTGFSRCATIFTPKRQAICARVRYFKNRSSSLSTYCYIIRTSFGPKISKRRAFSRCIIWELCDCHHRREKRQSERVKCTSSFSFSVSPAGTVRFEGGSSDFSSGERKWWCTWHRLRR